MEEVNQRRMCNYYEAFKEEGGYGSAKLLVGASENSGKLRKVHKSNIGFLFMQ